MPRPGSMRYQNACNEVVEAEPGSPYFSTVTMCATEWWDGEKWLPIWPDEDLLGEDVPEH